MVIPEQLLHFSVKHDSIKQMLCEKCQWKFEIICYTLLKNKIENNSVWEGAFYQSERVEIYWS